MTENNSKITVPLVETAIIGFTIGYFAFNGIAGGIGLAGFLLVLELVFIVPFIGFWLFFFFFDSPMKDFFQLSGSGEIFAIIYLLFFVLWIIYTLTITAD